MNQRSNNGNGSFMRTGISTRSKNVVGGLLANITNKQADKSKVNVAMAKRKAEESPPKGRSMKTMRSAFGDLTNNTVSKSTVSYDAKKAHVVQTKVKQEKQPTKLAIKPKEESVQLKSTGTLKDVSNQTAKTTKDVGMFVQPGIQTRRSLKSRDIPSKSFDDAKPVKKMLKKTASETATSSIAPRKTFAQFGKVSVPSVASCKPHENVSILKSKVTSTEVENQAPSARLLPKEYEVVVLSSDSSSSTISSTSSASSPDDSSLVDESSSKFDENIQVDESSVVPVPAAQVISAVPAGVEDFDHDTRNDPFQVSVYAMDIFNYLRERESKFVISDYMPKQVCLTSHMRALLVDWMVEIQETFELNHETLYLAVKLVDLYFSKVVVTKEVMQLIGAASIFIASKFDERTPPLIDDFLYICDGAYSHEEIIKAEINVVKIVDFDLGIPLSYRFLRRYARCAKVTMPILTLARYILEFALMDYSFIFFSDSKLAAAALFLALRMKNLGGWTASLEYYTSHKLDDLKEIVLQLNAMLHKKQSDLIKTVKNKYSHKIFFEVAKTPLLKKIEM